MAYFEDLSPYTYKRMDESKRDLVNVGWLEKGNPYPVGETPQEFRDKLELLCQRGDVRRRGGRLIGFVSCGPHHCDLCDLGRQSPWCSKEIRLRGAERDYAAPALVHHYVVVHGYLPPPEFIAAVLAWQGEAYEVEE